MQYYISVGISLPKKIVTKIDYERGDIPRSRYVLRIIEKLYKRGDDSEKRDRACSLDRRFETLQSSEHLKP
jgi:hypothetical protein